MRTALAAFGLAVIWALPAVIGDTSLKADATGTASPSAAIVPNPLRGGVPSPAEVGPAAGRAHSRSADLDQRIKSLRERLFHSDKLQAVEAVRELQKLGESGAAVLVESISGSRRPDAAVVFSAMRAIQETGTAAVPMLGEAATAESADGRAALLLGQMGAKAVGAAPALIRTLRDPGSKADQRQTAALLLGKIGPAAGDAIPALLDLFEQERDEQVRAAALEALVVIGSVPPQRMTCLLDCLASDNEPPTLRAAAASLLARQNSTSPILLPALIGLLHPSQNGEVCRQSAQAAAQLGSSAVDAVPALLRLLDHEDTAARQAAIAALEQIASDSPQVIAVIVARAQTDPDLSVRTAAAHALRASGPAGLAALEPGLQSTDVKIRENTLAALAVLGPAASSASSTLTRILSDAAQADWHLPVVNVLRIIRPGAAAAKPLVSLLANRARSTDLRVAAATALGDMGSAAASAVPLLTEILFHQEEEPSLRAAAAVALSRLEDGARDTLRKALQEAQPLVRIAAAWSLAQRDPTMPEAIASLLRELGDQQYTGYAEDALVLIGDPIVTQVAEVLQDERGERARRVAAARVLGRSGSPAISHLVDSLADSDDEVLTEVRRGLYEMHGPQEMPRLFDALHERTGKLASEPGNSRNQMIVDRLRRIVMDVSGELGGPTGGSAAAPGAMSPPHAARAAEAQASEPGVAAAPPASAPGAPEVTAHEAPSLPAAARDAPAREPARPAAALDAPAYKVVKVFYGTNRKPDSALAVSCAQSPAFQPVLMVGCATMLLAAFGFVLARAPLKAILVSLGLAATLSLAFSTDREALVAALPVVSRPGPIYGSELNSAVETGTCEVTIPATHREGELESPSIFRLEFQADPARHITVRSVRPSTRDAFFDELKHDLTARGPNILVFVHGYNVSFDDAARRTAQMAEDLDFPGIPLFFSWPSQGNWYEYRADEKQVELAVPHLRRFLLDVARQSGASSIHLVAHSMGNRALTAALREIAGTAEPTVRFNQVILAAPDIDADVFRNRIAPAIARTAQRVTLYASSNDLALVASRAFNSGDPRAGDSSRDLVVVDGVETIDVSDVDTSLLGHSYYGSNPTVLTDLKELLLHTLPAQQRAGLIPLGPDDRRYWALRHIATARGGSGPESEAAVK